MFCNHKNREREKKNLKKTSKKLLTNPPDGGIIYSVAASDIIGSIAQLGEHLPYKQRVTGSSPVVPTNSGPVAQLVRALACHARGRGFEPLPGRHYLSLSCAGVAQLAEQLICNQQVAGSSPFAGSTFLLGKVMGRFPSGQREQTVNLPSQTSVVRIHPCPPKSFSPPRRHHLREWRNWQTRMIQVHVFLRTCRFKSCFPHQSPSAKAEGLLCTQIASFS